jgi:hypothetical protein
VPPAIPFSQLLVAPTGASVRAEVVTALITVGIRADLWKAGGVASTLLTYVCNIYAGGMGLVTAALGGAFLTVAQGPWLALLAYYVYGITVQPATYAQGAWTLTNTSGSIYSKGAGTVTVQNPSTGVSYINVNPFTLAAHATLTGVLFQATTPGSQGSSGENQADVLVSTLNGVSVTNPLPVAGLDADPPALIIQKCLAAVAARSYLGPNAAYRFAVYTATNGSGGPLNINRISVVTDRNTGMVYVYLASPQGAPSSADLASAQTAINAVAQAMGLTATAVAATVQTITTPVTLWCTGTEPPATVENNALTSLDAYLAQYPIGGLVRPPSTQGYLYASLMAGSLAEGDPNIFDVQGVTADTPLASNAVPVFAGPITVRQVNQ